MLINPVRSPSIFRRRFPIRLWYPSQHLFRQNPLPRSQFGSRRRFPRAASQRQTVVRLACRGQRRRGPGHPRSTMARISRSSNPPNTGKQRLVRELPKNRRRTEVSVSYSGSPGAVGSRDCGSWLRRSTRDVQSRRKLEVCVADNGRDLVEADWSQVGRVPCLLVEGGGHTLIRTQRRLFASVGQLQSAGGAGTLHPLFLWCAGRTHQPDRPVSAVGDDVPDRRGPHARGNVVAAARGTTGARVPRN